MQSLRKMVLEVYQKIKYREFPGGSVVRTRHFKVQSLVWELRSHVNPLQAVAEKKKINVELPYDSSIPPLGTYSKELKAETDTCTSVFTAASLTTAKSWRQSTWPSTDKWMLSTYNGLFYSLKKEEGVPAVAHGKQSDKYPWGWGFNPRPPSWVKDPALPWAMV